MDKDLTVNLELLKDDLAFYNEMLVEVSNDILTGGFSQFPVFVTPEREESFKAAFKDPKKFMCVLLVTDKGASFVFVPFKDKK
jgi:hypothetical protein